MLKLTVQELVEVVQILALNRNSEDTAHQEKLVLFRERDYSEGVELDELAEPENPEPTPESETPTPATVFGK